jgi:demethylspheroidene O-methyltransferase
MGDAYFGVYLWAMGSGRPRTVEELTAMLRKAGFRRIRRRPTRIPLQTSVLVAERG